jgi:hypothetical protein
MGFPTVLIYMNVFYQIFCVNLPDFSENDYEF